MPTSRGRISRKVRLCPICKALNLKPLDYVLIALLLAGCAALAWLYLSVS